ncbi:MAG: hypothetical protein LBV41_10180 [Cytophagaceae bacterium]|nr:hypothetical protein [Cytophagaceae bacterium]
MAKSNSYAKQVSDAQTMATALEANLSTLEKRGMNESFINSLSGTLTITTGLNSKQERLKGELKSTTVELADAKERLHNLMAEAVKVVKLQIPQERWIEFGITGKR